MSHQLIPVWTILLNTLNTLLLSWIQLTNRLVCPQCGSQSFSPWGSYLRRWQMPGLASEYQWRVKRFRCTQCQRTFSRYTNTRWAHVKQAPGSRWLLYIYPLDRRGTRLYGQFSLQRRKSPQKLSSSSPPSFSVPVHEDPSIYLQELKFLLNDCLNETQRRLVVALEVLRQGRGGIQRLQTLTGMAPKTIRCGLNELENQMTSVRWGQPIRKPGAGRPSVDKNPLIIQTLENLLTDETTGDPMTALKWTRKTLRKLSSALAEHDLQAAPNTVRRLLHARGYSLRVRFNSHSFLSRKRGLYLLLSLLPRFSIYME